MGLINAGLGNISYSWPWLWAARLGGVAVATRMPSQVCEMVMFKAPATNTGTVYIGSSNVTSVTGYPLGPGDSSPTFPVKNLNLFYYVCDNVNSHLQYIVVGSGQG